jgi:hypothetical protein
MNVIAKLIIAILIGVIVAWLLGLFLNHTIAVILGLLAGVAYFVSGTAPTTRA